MSERIGGEGPLDCKIAIVGEAPGEDEVKQKRNFVGRAGQLLDKHLRMALISRAECYITNVVKVRPKNNDISEFIDLSKKGAPCTQLYKDFVSELRAELDACKANVIVATGNIPMFALTGKTGITKWRNSILESTLLPGRKVIPILHPSAALRMYIWEYLIANDLRRVKEESEFPQINQPYRELIIEPSYNHVMEFLDVCLAKKRVSFDIECSLTSFQVTCISFSYSSNIAISIPFSSRRGDYFSLSEEAAIWSLIALILENPDIEKIAHFAIFDCGFLLNKVPIKVRNVKCTMIGMGLIYPDFLRGLDFTSSIYTREPYYKEDGKVYMRYEGSDRDFWTYNAKDAAVTLEAYEAMSIDMEKLGLTQTFERQCAIIPPLLYLQERGIRMDTAALSRMSSEAEANIVRLTAELHKMCGFPINPNSPAQLKQYFYVTKGIRPYLNKGAITTDDDAMKMLARKGIREASIIRDIRHWTKQNSTYFKINLDVDGRLRCAMNPGKTVTGRLASSKTIFGTGGNMQNQIPEMKRAMLADEGYIGYNFDLSQAENRIVAYTAPEPSMIKAFDSGIDIHTQTASLVFGIPFNEVSDEPKSSPLGNGEESQRYWGKKANHSLNYDLGYRSFGIYYELPEHESKRIVERYHQVYPGIRGSYHRWVRDSLNKSRSLTNCYGRKRIFYERWGDELWKDAYAFIPQSTVADKINTCLRWIYDNLHEVEILNQVHDSIVVQIPTSIPFSKHTILIKAILSKMEEPVPWKATSFKIPADVKIGLNFYDMVKLKPDETLSDQIAAVGQLSLNFNQSH